MKASAQKFQRVRIDHALEKAEDYTELVLALGESGAVVRAADIARELGVSHVTVLRGLSRLARDGYLTRSRDRGVLLTAAGRHLAKKSRERHRIVLEFLLALGVPEREAAIDSEGIEHHVGKTTLECMKRALQRTAASSSAAARRS
jgi:DtxR family manganese transport transcriptional regulator